MRTVVCDSFSVCFSHIFFFTLIFNSFFLVAVNRLAGPDEDKEEPDQNQTE